MFKLGCFVDGEWREHSHSAIYSIEDLANGPRQKLLATAPLGDPQLLLALADRLRSPFMLLYVLHTPRGEGEPGRYQSGELSIAELHEFVARFHSFLSADGRFDLWVHSAADGATLIWDRHNLIHVYGQIELMAETLRGLGFSAGQPIVPSPHEHHYRASCDDQARALLASQTWWHSPLQPEDEQ